MAESNDINPRERILHAVQRQIAYLRNKPESRIRVIMRLEALRRISHDNVKAGDHSPLGRLVEKLENELPIQITLLKSDSKNDGKVAHALARIVIEASLFVRSFRSKGDTIESSEHDVDDLSFLDDDGTYDEDDLTRVLFGF